MKRHAALVLAVVAAVLVALLPAVGTAGADVTGSACEENKGSDGRITSVVRHSDGTVTVQGWFDYCQPDPDAERMGLPALVAFAPFAVAGGATLGTEIGYREVFTTFDLRYEDADVCLHGGALSLQCWSVARDAEPAPTGARYEIRRREWISDPNCGNCWRPVN